VNKYFAVSLSKKEKQELEAKLTSLDKRILEVSKLGAGISLLIAKSKSFINSGGSREYHSSIEVADSIKKLLGKSLMVRR
jgi:hypothetical protein